jgi:acid phosphatase (class A)
VDSYQDKADIAAVKLLQSVDQQRWKSAQVDAVLLYPRFDEALGKPIDRATSPLLIKLLNRTLRDISASAFSAKLHFQRPRPYQSLALQRVCGTEKPPVPESHPSSGSSYPSGHSAYGWAVAMVLARVSPGRTDALMIRAQQYAESRVICGVHFPSDVEAGQVLAAAVVARLDGSADFQADLARARAEYSSH